MKFTFVVLLVCLFNSVFADNYYFSTISGNDSRTVTEAQDPSTPWKSLNKLNSFFTNLKPGDAVYLKRGETFYGSIIVKQSGSATSPIVISAYGTGSKPIITSLVTLGGWVSKGNGIWESYEPTLSSSLNMVLLDGVQQEMGRYPNSTAENNGYLNFESHVGKTSITDNQMSTAINWKGAQLVLRPRHWILDRSLITAQVGRKISYTTTSPYEPYENYGYFIQNSLKTLDKTGEWYYNPATHKLSVFFGSKGPSGHVIQAATTTTDLVSSVKYSNIVFDNLSIKGANKSGFSILNGSDIHIQNCDILFSGITGVLVGGHTNLHIENCTIANSNNNAIDFQYGVNNAIIKNNRILNTGLVPGMMQNGEGAGLAIYTNGDGNTIENNEIRKTGFIGITFYGSNLIIKNNLIDSFCFVKDDGGGIYSHGGASIPVNRKLTGNIIMHGIGAGKGTDIPEKRAVTGIYMDANTMNVAIRDNTVTTCNQGIMLQSTSGMTVRNNTVYDNIRQMVMIRDKENNPVRNSIINGNIFFSKGQSQWALYVMSSANDIRSFGKFDSNYYARPIDDRITIYANYVGTNGGVTENFDLAGWKAAYGMDQHSKITAKQIEPYKFKGLVGANKFINGGDFTDNIKGISGSSCILSKGTLGLLDGGYLQVLPTAKGSGLYLKVGSVTKGKTYLLSYSVRGSSENAMSIGASLRQTVSPYLSLTELQFQNRKVTKTRADYKLLFSASTTTASAQVVFKPDDQSKYYIDNIKLYEADVQVTDPDDSIRFVYNAGKLSKTVSLSGEYIDTKGKVYVNRIVLQPYTSAILIKTNKQAQNAAPTVSITASINSNAVVSPLSSVAINARAADSDGTIEKVEFFNGSTLVLAEYKSPYDCVLDNLVAGNYSITAKATDDKGLQTTSTPFVFSVRSVNVAPVVAITSPANGSSFSAAATVELAASATDKGGSINKVDFYNGSKLLFTEYKVPYTYRWQNVPAGNYTITAKATDDAGLTTTSAPVKITVTAQRASRSASSVSNTSAGEPAISDSGNNMNTNRISADVALKGLSQVQLAQLSAFRLFPNPAVSSIQLSFDGLNISAKANLAIQNVAGAVVKKYPVVISGKKMEVDVSSLMPGIYIISLSGENFTVSKKFLKTN